MSAGGNTKVRVNLDGGYAQYKIVDANGAPTPGSTGWLIRPVQDGVVAKTTSAYGYNNAGTATLPTGSFEFSVDSQGIIGATQFDVKAGETVNLTVETVPKP